MKTDGKDRFDALLTSAPVNTSAARVTSRGEHWTPEGKMPPGLLHWKARPFLRAFYSDEQTGIDLTGKTFGRLTVEGLLDDDGGGTGRGQRWVVRCSCGDYEARSAKAIKAALAGINPENSLSFMCWYCWQWQSVKSRYNKKGSRPISHFTKHQPKTKQHTSPDDVLVATLTLLAKTNQLTAGLTTAVAIIAGLNRAGYRIIKDRTKEQERA